MKTGTIVYLSEAAAVPTATDLDRALEQTGLDPDWTEIAGAGPEFYRLQEALLALAQRGAGRVDLVRAAFDDDRHGLRLDGARTRLTG